MRIATGVYVLPIPRVPREAEGFLNLTLVLDAKNGNTLVDTGLPGQEEAIASALRARKRRSPPPWPTLV
jgi:glyoxylase-like metal-dependent hydrolase (beta-lactamase superfamily II)